MKNKVLAEQTRIRFYGESTTKKSRLSGAMCAAVFTIISISSHLAAISSQGLDSNTSTIKGYNDSVLGATLVGECELYRQHHRLDDREQLGSQNEYERHHRLPNTSSMPEHYQKSGHWVS